MKKIRKILICAISVIMIGCTLVKKKADMSGYTKLEEDHVFLKCDSTEFYKKLQNKETFVVYLGTPSCDTCQNMVIPINNVAKEKEIDVYYVCTDDNEEKNVQGIEYYDEIVEAAKELLPYNNDGKQFLYTPSVFCVKDGEIKDIVNAVSLANEDGSTEYSEERTRVRLEEGFSKIE